MGTMQWVEVSNASSAELRRAVERGGVQGQVAQVELERRERAEQAFRAAMGWVR